MAADAGSPGAIRLHRRVSTMLLAILVAITAILALGLVLVTMRLVQIEGDLTALRDSTLPRLAKLTQLSQEAAATIAIAPALSGEPTRFEFETLLARLQDKEASQTVLIEELAALLDDASSADSLRRDGRLLRDNLEALIEAVRQQIVIRERLEEEIETLRGLARPAAGGDGPAAAALLQVLNTLLDPNDARFSRNRETAAAAVQALTGRRGGTEGPAPEADFLRYWLGKREAVLEAKQAALANDFRIEALAEENALLANRLLSRAGTELWRGNSELQAHITAAVGTSRLALASIIGLALALIVGFALVWLVLERRVLGRLARMTTALRAFAETRNRLPADRAPDEIGAISGALGHYMAVIEAREAELSAKTRAMEQLSTQLAKYLSPQVYDSIFSGRQEVKVVSQRKKLTVFFSDIADFTETADRLESEDLTQIVNLYLTEMTAIALAHGATIDKYIGDAILIFFGDPDSRGIDQDALSCVLMAIAMRERLEALSRQWRDAGVERPFQVRIGIHTGYCTVGNFGSEDRMDYTIIGGTVNTASRLQTLAEPGQILVSFETFAHVKAHVACERHGEVEVKGLAYPVLAYRVVDTYERQRTARRHFHEVRSNLTVDLDLAKMSPEERAEAELILNRAIAQIANPDEAPDRSPPDS